MDETHGVVAQIDPLTGHFITIDSVHHRVHAGLMFQTDKLALTVANNDTIEIFVRIGAGSVAHMAFSAKAGGDAELQIFEGMTTVTDEGTTLTPQNRRRSSAIVSDISAFHTPDVTPAEASITDILVPGGSGGNSAGGDAASFAEWNLKADEDYLVRLTNRAGTAQNMGLEVDWYEPTATAP